MLRTMLVGWLGAAIGCAGVLGFEDIVVDEPRPSLSLDAGRRCRPNRAPLGEPRPLAGLGVENESESFPRLSDDELKIVFARTNDGGQPLSPFTATRTSVTSAFDAPVPLLPNVTPAAETPSLASGAIYFVVFSAGARRVHVALGDGQPLPIDALAGFDGLFPSFSDLTGELFFAAKVDEGTLAIFRSVGKGAAFGPAVRVSEIERHEVGARHSYTEPFLSADGTHLYFVVYGSRADGGGFNEAYVATRERAAPELRFSNVERLDWLDTPAARLGWLSGDECRLYLYAVTPPGSGRFRLFVWDREPE